MWQVEITEVKASPNEPSMASITFHYSHTDGRNETIIENNISDAGSLKILAKDHILNLEAIDKRKDSIINLIANPPLGPLSLTGNQSKDIAYKIARNDLLDAEKDLSLGLIDQAKFDEIKATTIGAKSAAGLSLDEPVLP